MGKTRNSANLVSDNNLFIDIANDRVGIGTTTPQYKVDVVGDINFTGSLNQGGSPFVASRWTTGTGDDIYRLNGDVGIGTAAPQYKLDVLGDINFTGTFRQNGDQFVASRWTSGTGDDIYRLNGDVGIGTTTPTTKLDVVGVVNAISFTGSGANLTNLNVSYTPVAGIATYATYASTAGIATYASTAGISTVSQGLTGTPNVTVGFATISNNLNVLGITTSNQTRFLSVAERLVRVNGNTVSIAYTSTGANIGLCTNPSGNITLAVTGIPTDISFDNHAISFSVFVIQTGTARSCTAVTLNGVTETIRWAGGSLSAAISGVTTTSGYDIYNFVGLNTIGSASTTTNYDVLGIVNGGFR